jgi:uncharacterized protein involved in outer membrane biogenesis
MSKGKKILISVFGILIILVLGVVIIVPLLIDVDRYRPEVVARIKVETGKPAEIGHLSLTLFPSVAIRVDDFSLGNPEGFPRGNFIKTKRIDAVVDGWALLSRKVIIKSLNLEEPEISMLESTRGVWNFETPQNSKPSKNVSLAAPPSSSSFSLGVINRVNIAKGHLSVSKLTASGSPEPAFFEARGLSSQLDELDVNAFSASLSKPFRQRGGTEIALTSWLNSFVVHAAPSEQLAAHGNIKAESLSFQTFHASAVESKVRLYPKEVFFDDLGLDLYGGHAKGNVSFNFGGVNPRYKAKAQVAGVDVARFLQEIPSARGYMTGKMQGNMDLDGEVTKSPDPLAGMRGAGNMSVKDGTLPKLQLGKNLMQLAKLSDLAIAKGDPSAFSSIAADLNIANNRITNRKITVVGNGLDAEGTGSTTLLGAGTLDYQGVANLAAGTNQLSSVLAGLSGATMSNGKMSFPFGIGGTLSAPKFQLKNMGAGQLGALGNLVGGQGATGTNTNQQQNPANLIQGIAGAFKKKKQ